MKPVVTKLLALSLLFFSSFSYHCFAKVGDYYNCKIEQLSNLQHLTNDKTSFKTLSKETLERNRTNFSFSWNQASFSSKKKAEMINIIDKGSMISSVRTQSLRIQYKSLRNNARGSYMGGETFAAKDDTGKITLWYRDGRLTYSRMDYNSVLSIIARCKKS